MAAFLFFLHRDQILLQGDALAHMSIARRVFDSRTPGLLQLGTVWLPLPHLLMIPFLWPDVLWRTGIGGSIPSMLAYIFACWGIFRLLRALLPSDASAHAAAWIATLLFAANPNLLYVQSVALTESVYLAFFIWSVVFLARFSAAADHEDGPAARHHLLGCGLCLAAAMMTRYDAWVIGLFIAAFAVARLLREWKSSISSEPSPEGAELESPARECRVARRTPRESRRDGTMNFLPIFLVICAAAPLSWLAYNRAVYGDALEFAHGPNSAQAIEHRINQPPHPGTSDLKTAALFYVRSVQRNLAEGNGGKVWLTLAAIGTLISFRYRWRGLIVLMLWLPLPFYALSVAHGGVPIYVPEWWPFGIYNVRYGLQLLPAVAVGTGLLAYTLASLSRRPTLVLAAGSMLIAGTCIPTWQRSPICVREAELNSRSRVQLETEVAGVLRTLPPDSVILMSLRDYAGVAQRAGLPLRRVLHSENHRMWKHPLDSEGEWERGQAKPQQFADYAVGFQGDVVDNIVRARHFTALVSFEEAGWPRATIYRLR